MRSIITFLILLFPLATYSAPLTVISPPQLTTGTYTISQPGLYVLGGDSTFTVTTGAALTITTSDVTLDLNGKTIRGSGGGHTGISIQDTAGLAGLENITVKNGNIAGFSNVGIYAEKGSTNLIFEGLKITGTGKTAPVFTGFSIPQGPPRTSNVTIKNCISSLGFRGASLNTCDFVTLIDSTFNLNGDNGILLQNSQSTGIKNCNIDLNTNEGLSSLTCTSIEIVDSAFTRNAPGAHLSNCEELIFNNCNISSNFGRGLHLSGCRNTKITQTNISANQLVGLRLDSYNVTIETRAVDMQDCTLSFNSGTGFFGSANDVFMNRCSASSNDTSGAEIAGSGWVIRNSDFNSNSSNFGAFGITIGAGVDNLVLENCVLNNNNETQNVFGGFEAAGLKMINTSRCVIRNCITSGNYSVTSTASGIKISGNCSKTVVEDCVATGNVVTGTIFNAYGFLVQDTAADNALINCTADGNKSDLALGAGFALGSSTGTCVIQNSKALGNGERGFLIESATAFLLGNVAMGNSTNYDGSGTYSFVTVTNGIQPPTGSFDERMVDNISIV